MIREHTFVVDDSGLELFATCRSTLAKRRSRASAGPVAWRDGRVARSTQAPPIISQLLLFLKEYFGCGFAALGNMRAKSAVLRVSKPAGHNAAEPAWKLAMQLRNL